MSHEFRDLFNVEVDEFQQKAKVSTQFSTNMHTSCIMWFPLLIDIATGGF